MSVGTASARQISSAAPARPRSTAARTARMLTGSGIRRPADLPTQKAGGPDSLPRTASQLQPLAPRTSPNSRPRPSLPALVARGTGALWTLRIWSSRRTIPALPPLTRPDSFEPSAKRRVCAASGVTNGRNRAVSPAFAPRGHSVAARWGGGRCKARASEKGGEKKSDGQADR